MLSLHVVLLLLPELLYCMVGDGRRQFVLAHYAAVSWLSQILPLPGGKRKKEEGFGDDDDRETLKAHFYSFIGREELLEAVAHTERARAFLLCDRSRRLMADEAR